MRRIFLYFFKNVFLYFFVFQVTILSIFIFLTYIEESRTYFSQFHPSFGVVALYYFFQIPALALTFMPIAVLFSFIVCLLTMNRAGEIIAMRAAGLSVSKIIFHFLIISFTFSIIHFFMDSIVLEKSTKKVDYIKNRLIENNKEDKPGSIYWLKNNTDFIHFKDFIPKEKKMMNTEYFYFKKTTMSLERFIKSDYTYFDVKKNKWIFKHNQVVDYGGTKIKNSFYETMNSDLNIDPNIILNFSDPASQNVIKIVESIKKKNQAGQNTLEFYYTLNIKLTNLVIYFVFVILIIPFIFYNERNLENIKSIAICFFIAFFYWFSSAMLKNFVLTKDVGKILGPWMIIFLIVLVGFFRSYQFRKQIY